jgi:glucosamine-6-phosphate deaminase
MKSITAHIKVSETKESAIKIVAREIANLIHYKPDTVLGLATGATLLSLYKELVRLHHEEALSFSQVTTFNLDEYLGITRSHPESYWHFMHRHFFNHINIHAANIHLPSPCVKEEEINSHCEAYEEKIRAVQGLDFQILGIGRNGHIGFNEPGAAKSSRTRRITLDEKTRCDATAAFNDLAHVPTHAITMGCGTILEARNIALLAFGSNKASIVKASLYDEISEKIPASYLQQHPNTTFYLDQAAASML